MIKLQEFMGFMEQIAPKDIAADFDNVGLLIGDKTAKINKILVCLDADAEVAQEAADIGAELVFSHHPLLFKPLKSVIEQDGTGKAVRAFIKNDLCLFAAHTNFDITAGGLGDYFTEKAELGNIIDTFDDCIGRITTLSHAQKLSNIIKKIKNNFHLDSVSYIGNPDRIISKIGSCNGSGGDYIYAAKAAGADLFVSGDFKYHHARFAYENDIAVIEVSHYDAEIIFCEYIKEILDTQFADRIETVISQKNINPWKKN